MKARPWGGRAFIVLGYRYRWSREVGAEGPRELLQPRSRVIGDGIRLLLLVAECLGIVGGCGPELFRGEGAGPVEVGEGGEASEVHGFSWLRLVRAVRRAAVRSWVLRMAWMV